MTQFLERMTLVPIAGGALEALYHRGDGTPVVLAPSRPAFGSQMDDAVLSELCWGLTQAGHPTLRFNWAGVGASSGTSSDGDLDLDLGDLTAAIDLMRETTSRPQLTLVGHGHGCRVAAAYARQHAVARLVAIAPTEAIDPPASPARVFVGALDETTPTASLRMRWGDALTLIPGADHRFTLGLSGLRDAVTRFVGAGS